MVYCRGKNCILVWSILCIVNHWVSMYINSVNLLCRDFLLAQLVGELHLCLFLCVIQRHWDQLPAEAINNCCTVHGGDASSLNLLHRGKSFLDPHAISNLLTTFND